jgi:hypothetical protein
MTSTPASHSGRSTTQSSAAYHDSGSQTGSPMAPLLINSRNNGHHDSEADRGATSGYSGWFPVTCFR